ARPLATGTHAIQASYGGATGFAASIGTLAQTVRAAATTLKLTTDTAAPVDGQWATYTAAVTSPYGTPSGSVTVSVDGATPFSGTLDGAGEYVFAQSLATG